MRCAVIQVCMGQASQHKPTQPRKLNINKACRQDRVVLAAARITWVRLGVGPHEHRWAASVRVQQVAALPGPCAARPGTPLVWHQSQSHRLQWWPEPWRDPRSRTRGWLGLHGGLRLRPRLVVSSACPPQMIGGLRAEIACEEGHFACCVLGWWRPCWLQHDAACFACADDSLWSSGQG